VTVTFGEGPGTTFSGVTFDTDLREGQPDQNNGTHADMHIDSSPLQRGLIRFDISDIPAGSTIVGAELDLHTGSSPPIDCMMRFYAVLESWTEGSVNMSPGVANWIMRTADDAWSSPGAEGGAHDPNAVGELAGANSGTGYTVDIDPAAVQDWLDEPAANFGLLIAEDDTVSCYGWFMSSEAGDEDQRPLLRVSYVEP
jgi:hypothetical protein